MAIVGTRVQQPIECILFEIDYTQFLNGRVASSMTPVLTTPSGQTLNASNISGSKFQTWPTGGTDQTSYKWVVITTFVIGGFVERVKDIFYIVVTEQ